MGDKTFKTRKSAGMLTIAMPADSADRYTRTQWKNGNIMFVPVIVEE